ncbi:hypothetical protein AM571_PB00255 (plasmid) [Rhizobium etli 8C-3]|uniref:Uncharacterized protein n=1 Tax=Rhizobium etli 8C-3 TaxID=538025 RepID=A0A1L5PBR7_RHIET|nr:hypothetical protein IE4803_PB00320 [Rhizobium etli bv. phaseoli str. IE4803]APO77540.1 hypothetical protein AM571_PB00255 [Rhizobium etli 8C-3]
MWSSKNGSSGSVETVLENELEHSVSCLASIVITLDVIGQILAVASAVSVLMGSHKKHCCLVD